MTCRQGGSDRCAACLQLDETAVGARQAASPDPTGTVRVVTPLLQLLSPREAVIVAEAVADRLPPTPARVRLLLAACVRYAVCPVPTRANHAGRSICLHTSMRA